MNGFKKVGDYILMELVSELAEELGIENQYLADVVFGDEDIDIELAFKLSKRFGLGADTFLFMQEVMRRRNKKRIIVRGIE